MTPFSYTRAGDMAEALLLGSDSAAAYLGGGTNIVDLMRETVARPATLVDVTGLSNTIRGDRRWRTSDRRRSA
jgi:xanthine dehydrogenase YagS FAD-binding subunit